MSLQVFPQMDQRSPEWHEARRGLVTASTVKDLLTTRRLTAVDYMCPACSSPAGDPCIGARGGPIKTMHTERTAKAKSTASPLIIEPASNEASRSLTDYLVAERITGHTEETRITDDMFRGICDEPIARDLYAEHYAPVNEVGFITEDHWGFTIGYSPDGLVGDEGLIEVKSRRQKSQFRTIINGAVPIEHMAQMQAGLLVTGRKWCDFISYAGGMHLYVHRVRPDDRWQSAIVAAVRQFEANAAELLRLYAEATEGLVLTERIAPIEEIRI